MASDGQWYAPELHPDARAASQVPAAPDSLASPNPAALPGYVPPAFPTADTGATGAQTISAGSAGSAGPNRTRLFVLVGLLVVVIALGVAYLVHRSSSSTTSPVATTPATSTPATQQGSKGPAEDRVAQAELNSALTAASAFYEGNGRSFATLTPAALQSTLPSISVVGAGEPSTTAGTISLASTTQAVLLTDASASGTCWWILHIAGTAPGVAAGLPTAPGLYDDRSTGPLCRAAGFPTRGWQTTGFTGLG